MLAHEDTARGNWQTILAGLGLDDRQLSGRQVDCPICGGKTRFRFDDKEGRGTWFCNHCGAGDGYKLVSAIRGIGFKESLAYVRKQFPDLSPKTVHAPKAQFGALIRRLWREAKWSQEIGWYLRTRGLTTQDADGLRYHPAMAYEVGIKGAILAPIYMDGKIVTLHRTFIEGDKVLAKKVMSHDGPKLKGSYIPLGRKPNKVLGIAEGIETALSAARMMRESGAPIPVWSCWCAPQLAQFNPPKGVETVVVFGDNDHSYTGQAAAYESARRLREHGYEVHVGIPAQSGSDWNDSIRESRDGEVIGRIVSEIHARYGVPSRRVDPVGDGEANPVVDPQDREP